MSVIWQKEVGGTLYEVRTAGSSVRLYTGGIFHSQWNPKYPLCGSLWDLLVLPALTFYVHITAAENLRCAVLGVGGGAVLNQLRHFFPGIQVTGVDLDRTHLSVARNHFRLNRKNILLEHSCAIAWVEKAEPMASQYDLIVEDLFVGQALNNGKVEPARALAVDEAWLSSLSALLNDQGTLVINFESLSQFKKACKLSVLKSLGFESILAFTKPQYHNAIGVFSRVKQVSNPRKHLMQNLEDLGALSSPIRKRVVDFKIHRVR